MPFGEALFPTVESDNHKGMSLFLWEIKYLQKEKALLRMVGVRFSKGNGWFLLVERLPLLIIIEIKKGEV